MLKHIIENDGLEVLGFDVICAFFCVKPWRYWIRIQAACTQIQIRARLMRFRPGTCKKLRESCSVHCFLQTATHETRDLKAIILVNWEEYDHNW